MMDSIVLFFISFAATCIAQAPNARAETSSQVMNLPLSEALYDSVDSLKKDYSGFSCDWLEFERGENNYVICLITLPSYGSSSHSLRGWTRGSEQTKLELFLYYRIRDLGNVKLDYSPENMQLSLIGAANNKYSDVTVLKLDLR